MLVSWQLRLARDSFKRSLDVAKKHGFKNQYGAVNGMSILNIFHDGKLDIRAPYGKRNTHGEQLLPMAEVRGEEERLRPFFIRHQDSSTGRWPTELAKRDAGYAIIVNLLPLLGWVFFLCWLVR
ncbi:MAG TPA: hypothetical protein VK395_33020 [Gemmataceae bacterium]|nr:hypothetical protein [Gemmataceae bacterium]